jgi:hypothetical protein
MVPVSNHLLTSDEKDHSNGEHTIAEARMICEPDPTCFGFTFEGAVDTSERLTVFFKGAQKFAPIAEDGWSAFTKPDDGGGDDDEDDDDDDDDDAAAAESSTKPKESSTGGSMIAIEGYFSPGMFDLHLFHYA